MIPFKQKPNSILKNTAVLIILLYISDSCFGYLQDSRRTNEDFTDYQSQVTAKDQYRHSATALQREAVGISPYIRDVRADSRQSRIDSRDIRTDFREIRTELPESSRIASNSRSTDADRREYSTRRRAAIRDLNNNTRRAESARNARDVARDRRDAINNIRDSPRQYQNYSPQRFQRQLSDERIRNPANQRREFDSTRKNGRFVRERSQEDGNTRVGDNERRQIRQGALERTSEDRRRVREESLNSRDTRQRSDDRTTSRYDERRSDRSSQTSRQNPPNLRNVHERSDARQDRREVREDARQFRNVQRRFDERRITSRSTDDRLFARQTRRDVSGLSRGSRAVQERSDNRRSAVRQDTRQENRRMREIVLERRGDVRERYNNENLMKQRTTRLNLDRQQRDFRENSQTRHRSIRENTDIPENRQDSRERLQSCQNIRDNVRFSRNSRVSEYRLEDSEQDERRRNINTREWPRTLRERDDSTRSSRLVDERQRSRFILRERPEISRDHPEARREHSRRTQEDRNYRSISERNTLPTDRRTEESRNSRTTSQQAERRRESSEIVRDRREVRRERKDVQNSRRIMLQREDSGRRERHERREIMLDSRETHIRRLTDTDVSRNLKDSTIIKTEALRNIEFIPNLKQKTDVLSNTLQALLVVALLGQIFFNTSKSRFGFSSLQNPFGKEKVF